MTKLTPKNFAIWGLEVLVVGIVLAIAAKVEDGGSLGDGYAIASVVVFCLAAVLLLSAGILALVDRIENVPDE